MADFVQNFDKIPLHDDDFEFPDLLGAAYEWLIKYFADSAGKKAGEFYTPAKVVRICVEICDPQEGMSVYDPACGSGGMLLEAVQYLRRAVEQGYSSLWLIRDPDLASLHGDPEFEAIVEELRRRNDEGEPATVE